MFAPKKLTEILSNLVATSQPELRDIESKKTGFSECFQRQIIERNGSPIPMEEVRHLLRGMPQAELEASCLNNDELQRMVAIHSAYHEHLTLMNPGTFVGPENGLESYLVKAVREAIRNKNYQPSQND